MEHETEALMQFISDEMYGYNVNLVIQKRLYASDVKPNTNCLIMPVTQLTIHIQDWLTAEEERDVETGVGIRVRLVGPKLQIYEKPMVLNMWHMVSSKNLVLRNNWYSFVKDNKDDIVENSMIQVWSFRKDQELYLALVVVQPS